MRNPEQAPVGISSGPVHNRNMEFDATQRRQALQAFIDKEDLKVHRWEQEADLGDGTLRKFMKHPGGSGTLTDKTYSALAQAATRMLHRPITVAELQNAPIPTLSTGRVTTDTSLPPKSEVRRIYDEATRLNFEEMPKDVPVYGTVSGGPGGLQMGNGNVQDYVRRPPRFKDRKGKDSDVFAVIVEDVSMSDRIDPGDLVYVDPLWKPTVGDYVIVEIQEGPDAEPRALIKKLIARSPNKITLEQFKPPKQFDVPMAHVRRLYRAFTKMKDVMGV